MGIIVLWSDSAIDELQDIYDYYKLKTNKQIAEKISNAIIDQTILLEDNPYMGKKEEILKDKYKKLRYLIEGNYKIVYLIENEIVTIATVFDCRQNPKKLKETLI